jgi:shikimate kinase
MGMRLSVTSRNIVLMGFMGSGKSGVGRALAERLNRLFLDTDSVIESSEDKKIMDIFAEKGEAYFRSLEKELGEKLTSSVSSSVIAVGGGFPTAFKEMRTLGFVVFLNIDFDFMVEQLRKYKGEFEKRPLLQDLQMARKIYDSRQEIYRESADMVVDVTSAEIDVIVQKILKGVDIGE